MVLLHCGTAWRRRILSWAETGAGSCACFELTTTCIRASGCYTNLTWKNRQMARFARRPESVPAVQLRPLSTYSSEPIRIVRASNFQSVSSSSATSCSSAVRSTAVQVLRKSVCRPVPDECIAHPDMIHGRDTVGRIQGCNRKVDFIAALRSPVGQRCTAAAAETTANRGGGVIDHRLTGGELERGKRDRQPGNDVCSGGPTAGFTVAQCGRSDWSRAAIAHGPAKAAPAQRCVHSKTLSIRAPSAVSIAPAPDTAGSHPSGSRHLSDYRRIPRSGN